MMNNVGEIRKLAGCMYHDVKGGVKGMEKWGSCKMEDCSV